MKVFTEIGVFAKYFYGISDYLHIKTGKNNFFFARIFLGLFFIFGMLRVMVGVLNGGPIIFCVKFAGIIMAFTGVLWIVIKVVQDMHFEGFEMLPGKCSRITILVALGIISEIFMATCLKTYTESILSFAMWIAVILVYNFTSCITPKKE